MVVDGTPDPGARVRLPLSMHNRQGLVAGATGTGETKTLQLIAEQLSAAGAAGREISRSLFGTAPRRRRPTRRR